jgi:hypothetical protein
MVLPLTGPARMARDSDADLPPERSQTLRTAGIGRN